MRSPRIRGWLLAAIAGVAVLSLGVAGIAWASVPDASGVIHGCLSKKDGALRVIDTAAGGSCSAKETAMNWSQGLGASPGPNASVWTQPVIDVHIAETQHFIAGFSLPAGSYLVMATVTAVPDDRSRPLTGSCLIAMQGPTDPQPIAVAAGGMTLDAPAPAGVTSVSTFTTVTLVAAGSGVGLTCSGFPAEPFTVAEANIAVLPAGQINPPAA